MKATNKMKRMKSMELLLKIAIYFFTGALPSVVVAQTTSLIPLPRIVQWDTSTYALPVNQVISYNAGAERTAVWLGKLLEKGKSVTYSKDTTGNWRIVYAPNLLSTLGAEGYILDINEKGIKIQGATDAGLFYAIQTIRQLLPEDLERHVFPTGVIAMKGVHIEDSPLYSWRGCMIDLARSFINLQYLKEHVDRMALYKLNRLHLHLTDDQGWRIEIKSKPDLITIGAKGAVSGGTAGFLTQSEYMELQDYAQERMITIVPEIDMPGHIYSALVSYPELNCSGFSNLNPKYATPPALYSGVKVGWSKFCFSKPAVVYEFVSTVIGEIATITKGNWIHIGGDEINDPSYGTFVQKADSIVRSKGKISIGWEEVLKENVSNALLGQIWTGTTPNNAGCNTIVSLCRSFYLDHGNVPGQPNTNNWCSNGVTLESVYDFTMSGGFKNPQGVEAALWTEFVNGYSEFDNRLWPRMMAVSEVAWTEKSQRILADFKVRLGEQGRRLDYMGTNYYKTPDIPWTSGTVSNPATNALFGYVTQLDVLAGIDDKLSIRTPLTFYPNPAGDVINLSKTLYHVEILDNTGRLVLQAEEAASLNVSGLTNGIYYVRASNGTGKFLVMRD